MEFLFRPAGPQTCSKVTRRVMTIHDDEIAENLVSSPTAMTSMTVQNPRSGNW